LLRWRGSDERIYTTFPSERYKRPEPENDVVVLDKRGKERGTQV